MLNLNNKWYLAIAGILLVTLVWCSVEICFCIQEENNPIKELKQEVQYQESKGVSKEDILDVYKAGYYSGGIRVRNKQDLDKYWVKDSEMFCNYFFKTIKIKKDATKTN
jgi:hypothetical protein